MQTTLTQIGNSLGIIIPKEVLAAMNVKKGETVTLTQTPSGFTISTYNDEIAEQIEAAKEGMAQYRNTLRKLAE